MSIIEPEFMELTRDLDLQAFWSENEQCKEYTPHKKRCSMSFSPDDHWLFEFVKIPSTLRYYQDCGYRNQLHRQVNTVTEAYVGKSFFDEDSWENAPKRIENLFECEFTTIEGGTPWLTPATRDPKVFAEILDKAEKTNLKEWAFPPAYRQEWQARQRQGKPLPLLGSGSRGPATIITSVIDAELVFFWFYDHPELMQRLRDILALKMVEFNQILRAFSGNTQLGWWITDDNCALFNKRLYQEYCLPVLSHVLNSLAPGQAYRYQHSDSAMGHLLDFQRELGINSVNYGPTVDVGLIREKMPGAMINGQLPPMLLRNGAPAEIEQRIIADFRKGGAGGGLNVATAGSTAAGTGVGRMRWMMKVVQEHCRYD